MLLTSQEAVRATQNNATLIHSPLDYAAFHNFGWGLDVRVRPRFVDATSKNDPANMTLENVMIRSNLVVSDAVCCTTNMNVKVILQVMHRKVSAILTLVLHRTSTIS